MTVAQSETANTQLVYSSRGNKGLNLNSIKCVSVALYQVI